MKTTPGGLFRVALAAEGRGFALAAATVLLMLHSLAEAAIPVMIGLTIDLAVLPADPAALALWLGLLLALFVVLTVCYQSASWLMVSIYGHGEQALRHLTLSRMLRPRLSQHPLSAGEALTYATSDTYRVAGVAWSVAQQCATLAAIAGSALAMLVISPVATAVVFGATIAMMVIMRAVSRPLERRGLVEQQAATEAGAVAADFMTGFRVLVGMGARGEAVRRYAVASDRSRVAATAAARTLAGYEAVSAILAAVTITGLAGLSAWFAAEGQISLGELVTVLGLAQFVSGSLAYAGSFPSNWIHKLASAKRLAEVINADDLIAAVPAASAGDASIARPEGVVLSFRVPAASGTHAEHRIDVFRGELIGIRPSDSEAARSLSDRLGMRTPVKRGEISIDVDGAHRDLRDLDPTDYRDRVVSMPHRHAMMSGSLFEAVRGPVRAGDGVAGVPDSEVDTVAVRAAALHDTVVQVGGWDAPVGEAGRRLSGGQRQRIGIARGLHAGSEVLVLDEPTSVVDAITEAHIAEALSAHDATLVLISTSPVLLGACDRVVEWVTHE